jgi:hypothetical protein
VFIRHFWCGVRPFSLWLIISSEKYLQNCQVRETLWDNIISDPTLTIAHVIALYSRAGF